MLIRVRCCVSHPLSFSRVWRLPSVSPRYCSTAPTCVVAFSYVCCFKCGA